MGNNNELGRVWLVPLDTPPPASGGRVYVISEHNGVARWFGRVFLRRTYWRELGATEQPWRP